MEEMLKKAWELFDSGKLTEAEEIYLKCLEQLNDSDHDQTFSILMGLIYVESFLKKFEPARNYAELLLKDAQNDEEKHIVIHQAGMVERMAGNYEKALQLFMQEFEIISEFFGNDDMQLSVNLYEQAYVCLKSGRIQEAEEKMNRSLEHALKSEDKMCIGCSYRGLGEIMNAYSDHDKQAQVYFEKAIEAFAEIPDLKAIDEIKAMMR